MNYEQFVILKNRIELSGKLDDWNRGLGLLDPVTRVSLMYTKARQAFIEALEAGYSPNEAADKALGLDGKFRGQRGDINQEGVTPPKPTLSDLT
jgi:hypothetical protein